MTPLHRLAIMAVNELLSCNAITLEAPSADGRPGGDTGHIHTQLAGKPTVINWHDIGHGELRISVWWDYDHSKHPQAYPELPDGASTKECFTTASPLAKRQHYPKFVGVTLSFWLERKNGKWIQCQDGTFTGFERYIRKGMQSELDALPAVTPAGFKAKGRFFF
ncbi:hypothetical protein [Enterobacter hormaechei]|uniref:hypothetical protein n=1 Tax=Enterobacter hormaechei TaxID=158836 RepID=UPI00256F5C07|nr:hypothetical protein [Enterobacter hormaechei]MDL5405651.1 hypothetical protein [Enterobacter hormaechei]